MAPDREDEWRLQYVIYGYRLQVKIFLPTCKCRCQTMPGHCLKRDLIYVPRLDFNVNTLSLVSVKPTGTDFSTPISDFHLTKSAGENQSRRSSDCRLTRRTSWKSPKTLFDNKLGAEILRRTCLFFAFDASIYQFPETEMSFSRILTDIVLLWVLNFFCVWISKRVCLIILVFSLTIRH